MAIIIVFAHYYYRNSLFSRVSREKSRSSTLDPCTSKSSHVNYRFLSSPEKVVRMRQLRTENLAMKRKIANLEAKINDIICKEGIEFDDETTSDLRQIMMEHDSIISKFPEDSFQPIYWKQQKEAVEKHKNGIRWHPLMIRWCLYLHHLSSKAYATLRETGCLRLPSERTLRDYSHCFESRSGFSDHVDEQIMLAAKMESSPEWHRLVVLLMDEMYIKESLVYNKHTGQMVGFVDLGSVNNHLLSFEKSVSDDYESEPSIPTLAISRMVFMVRGLSTSFRFPYVQLPCSTITGDLIFEPFWEAIFHLERIGFKVSELICFYLYNFHIGFCYNF